MKRKVATQIERLDLTGVGPLPLIGVDEVGRGCLAGPVFAAAVYFLNDKVIDEVTDSKLISESRREELAELILQNHKVSIAFANVDEIDEINILKASLLAMKRAVEGLKINTGHILVDGNQRIPGLDGREQTTVIKGDLRVAQISAASIVAKVHRDRLMKNLAREYPNYGFEIHKGYATEVHRKAIQSYGPCLLHRKSFSGVKEHLAAWNRI